MQAAGVKMFELNKSVIPRVMAHWKDLAYNMIYVVLEMFKHLIKMAGVTMNTVNSCLPTVYQ